MDNMTLGNLINMVKASASTTLHTYTYDGDQLATILDTRERVLQVLDGIAQYHARGYDAPVRTERLLGWPTHHGIFVGRYGVGVAITL